MKLLFVCNEYPPTLHGGIGTFIQTLSRQLVCMGEKIFVVGFDPSMHVDKHEIDHGVYITRLKDPYQSHPKPRLGRYSLDLYDYLRRNHLSKALDKIVSAEKIDLVESYDWSGPLGSKPSAPLVVRLHGANFVYAFNEGKKASIFVKRKEFNNIIQADYIIAVSRHIGDTTGLALSQKLVYKVIYNGVDTTIFSPDQSPDDPTEILFVGTINRRKGVYELLNTAPIIFSQRSEVHFKFVGNISENDRKQILERISQLPEEWKNKVQFIGRVPYNILPDIYRHSGIVVFSSLAEAFGLTCIEAMACGKPVVVTSLASGPELVEDGHSGILADPRNSQEFAGAILQFLEDPGLRLRIGENARKRTLQMFNLKDLATTNQSYYQSILR